MTIVLKDRAAADVPVHAGGGALFLDISTGLPAIKRPAGTVVPLSSLPQGGTAGQVLTRAADGVAWADTVVGSGEPAGTWVNALPPDGVCSPVNAGALPEEGDPLATASLEGVVFDVTPDAPTASVCMRLSAGNVEGVFTRVRGTASVLLDIAKVDVELPAGGAFVLRVGSASFVMEAGANTVTFELPMSPTAAKDFSFDLDVEVADATNVERLWTSLTVSACELFACETGTAANIPFATTPIVVRGFSDGGGGISIAVADNPALATATTVAVTSIYDGSNDWPEVEDAWLGRYTLTEVGPLALTLSGGTWHRAYNAAELADGWWLVQIAIDGAAPVLAQVNTQGGW